MGDDVAVPAFIEPQLCTPVTSPPAGKVWIHEPKLDGYRLLARKDGDDVRLCTRTGLDWTARFPSLAAAVRRLPVPSAWLDGEAVALEPSGPSFHALQRALAEEDIHAPILYLVFDAPFVDGRDVRALPLRERKVLLGNVLSARHEPLHDDDICMQGLIHSDEDGVRFLERMEALGLEGMVSKRLDAPYEAGRQRTWQKLRIVSREEFIVVGFTPIRARTATPPPLVGALLLAGAGDTPGALIFRGRVGAGFTDRDRRELFEALAPRVQAAPPVSPPARARDVGQIRWVEPTVVVEVAYREITPGGLLRHAVFEGLRRDKTIGAIHRRLGDGIELLGPSSLPGARAPGTPVDVVAGVRISSPGRVVYPRVGAHGADITKVDLARYVEAVAPLMLPHVAGRPLAVVRCPDGVRGPGFYQKHKTPGMPRSVGSIDISEEDGDPKSQLMVEDAEGLVALVQMGALEIHPWGVATHAPDQPDRLIFDLDPAEDRSWADVAGAAREVRQRLVAAGLVSFPKTTGGKGLHVVAPLDGTTPWSEVRTFARDLAATIAAESPRTYTTSMRKGARTGRVFIDHLRNARGSTAIAPWSMRRREGAPVAVPVAWEELDDIRGDSWSVLTLLERVRSAPDPWPGYFTLRQVLPQR